MIDIETWINTAYEGSQKKPAVKTVRAWVRDGKIHPAPEKHGRAYYFNASARYCNNKLAARILNNAQAPQTR